MEYDNWQPADGLLLSPDNPYSQTPAAETLSEYTSTYEHWRIPELQIRYNERDRGLEAIFRSLRFPLYFQTKDVFEDAGGDAVTFERDAQGKVIGYRRSSDPDRLMRRLQELVISVSSETSPGPTFCSAPVHSWRASIG
ncbi:MAG: hypothetical protein ACI81P_002971 [Neolewinella sp.]|jgi:hypothetical protein